MNKNLRKAFASLTLTIGMTGLANAADMGLQFDQIKTVSINHSGAKPYVFIEGLADGTTTYQMQIFAIDPVTLGCLQMASGLMGKQPNPRIIFNYDSKQQVVTSNPNLIKVRNIAGCYQFVM